MKNKKLGVLAALVALALLPQFAQANPSKEEQDFRALMTLKEHVDNRTAEICDPGPIMFGIQLLTTKDGVWGAWGDCYHSLTQQLWVERAISGDQKAKGYLKKDVAQFPEIKNIDITSSLVS